LQTKSWTEKYRPKTSSSLLGNEDAVLEFKSWLNSWILKRKPKKACLLVGPPGVGKTSLARAAANEYGFQIVELNASDVRTQKSIEHALTPASTSITLDSFSSNGRGNLILLDEVDGVFGREDRGGLLAILAAVKDPAVPVVLTANNIEDDRFDDLRKICLVLELHEIRPRYLVLLINHILNQEGESVAAKTVDAIVRRSSGDIRSAINDAQAAAAGTFDDRGGRTRSLDPHETLTQLFTPRFGEARRALNETEIPLYKDQLLLLLHDLIPYIYTSPLKLAHAYEALSRADITYARIGANRSRSMAPPPFNIPRRDSVPQWNLLPVALNELASVGVDQIDNEIDKAIQTAPRISEKTLERYQYRLWSINHACGCLAKACHTSKRTALHHILPYLLSIFSLNEEVGREVATAMELEERDIQFLTSEAKTTNTPAGPEEVLDPANFKLPFMGKDKFVQLMRAGLKYDSANRRFSVRRMDNLDSVEESLSQIVAKPVKFIRPNVAAPAQVLGEEEITKLCYVDGTEISCGACEFVDNCPTHVLSSLKPCLCSHTLSDSQGYEKYINKNELNKLVEKPAKKPATRRKQPTSRKKAASARD
jgi:replication factor C large subunit